MISLLSDINVCILDIYESSSRVVSVQRGRGRNSVGRGRRQEEREVVDDLSLQIGTKETFPNRMWLWFLTSFHSQLSDRFLLRWHLLHNITRQKKKWNGSEMRQLLPYMPAALGDIINSAALLWLSTTSTTTKLKVQLWKWCAAPPWFLPFCSPLLFLCVFASLLWAVMTYLPMMCQHTSFEQMFNHSCLHL